MQQSDIELAISSFSKIEQRLVEDLGARAKNGASRTSFIERLSEVEHLFTAATIQRLRSIASVRNKLAHGEITAIPNREQFIKDCGLVDLAIDFAKEQRGVSTGSTTNLANSAPPVKERQHKNGKAKIVVNVIVLLFFILVSYIVFNGFRSAGVLDKHFGAILNQSEPLTDVNADSTDRSSEESMTVKADVLKKGVSKDFFGEFLFCKVKFSNTSGKNITGIRGQLIVDDVSGKHLHTFNFFYDGKIKAKSSLTKEVGSGFGFDDKYNQFEEKDRLFKNKALTELKFTWQPAQIVFEDGTETAR